MSWSKVCDKLHAHPKARRAGLEAMGLWVMALSFCGAYPTDGAIGRVDVVALAGGRAGALAARLVAAGLWVETPDGWAFHDYLDHNPGIEAAKNRREVRAAAGRIGGIRSGQTRSKNEASASTMDEPPIPSRPVPDPSGSDSDPPVVPPVGDLAKAPEGVLLDVGKPPRAARGERKKPATAMPPGWAPTEGHRAMAAKMGLDLAAEVARFRDHHEARGSVFASWDAALRTWLSRAPGYAQRGAAPGGQGRVPSSLQSGGTWKPKGAPP